MNRSRSVSNFLDCESRGGFAESKSVVALSVPGRSRDQDYRRNSNISCETSSSIYSDSNENLRDFCLGSPAGSESLSPPEILHVAVLGDRGVGKRCLIHQFIDTDLEDIWSDLTDFVEDTEICVSIDGKETSLMFVEHMNLENVEVCNLDALIVMYSVTDPESFKFAGKLVGGIRKRFQRPIVMVANKVDLTKRRGISKKDGEKIARMSDCTYLEISIVLNHNVDDLLVDIVRQARSHPQYTPTSTTTEKHLSRVQQFTKNLIKRWRKIRPKRSRCKNRFDP
uniref:Ras-related protein Rap-2a-like n=1 Tax=Crassostrea virginica TaxID=6565 RepID=A0A8B8EUQ3_CRAVI|nr:ras-related protein Rap-2a-like [Crassostrea virginica]